MEPAVANRAGCPDPSDGGGDAKSSGRHAENDIPPLLPPFEIACIVERRLRAIITVVIEWQGSYREAREPSMRPVAPAVTPMVMATAVVLAIMELRKFFRLDPLASEDGS